MSLSIQTDEVTDLLLTDRWYKVKPGSFRLDIYEFPGHLNGGQEQLLPSMGAGWTSPDGSKMFCPITSVSALRTKARRKGSSAA
jgi:hypothetical protein